MLTPRRAVLLAFAVLALPLLAQTAVAAKKGKRFGVEGRIVRFEDAQDQLVVNVAKTKVSGFGGSVAGDPAPDSVKRGEDVTFAVVPEGSVLRRTVIKSLKGGGLNNGSRESFVEALSAIPTDRNVIFSFEQNPKGQPPWLLKMIQIRMTQEEIDARLEEISVEE